MKTTKLTISILLVAIATTGYGQILGFENQALLEGIKNRLFPNRNQDVEYITVNYMDEPGRIENWMSDLNSWAIDLVSKEAYEAPAISRTITVDRVEVVFESDPVVESWMNAPFESAVREDVAVEGWMAAPFEAALEEDVAVEDWMTAPFEAGLVEEDVAVEEWMTSAWN